MKESLQQIIGWGYPLLSIILVTLAATRRNLPGKPWLVAYLAIGLVTMLAWRLPVLLERFDSLEFDISRFYDLYALPLRILGLVGFCMLFPFLLAISGSSDSRVNHGDKGGDISEQQSIPVTGDTTNPLYGVHGWLKFFVVMHMYIAPVLIGVQLIISFIGIGMLAKNYPGLVVVGVIEAAGSIFLVVKWIMIARRVRDIASGVIQEAKKWLWITLAWSVLSAPLVFMSGMDAEDVMVEAIKQLFMGIISFAIWYSYFNVSKRVKTTYPDWNK